MSAAALLLVASLGVAACEGASRNQQGNPDEQGAGSTPEKGQGTTANDTAPFRPGAAGSQNAGPSGPGADTTAKQP